MYILKQRRTVYVRIDFRKLFEYYVSERVWFTSYLVSLMVKLRGILTIKESPIFGMIRRMVWCDTPAIDSYKIKNLKVFQFREKTLV